MSHPLLRRSGSPGFTLIELLVVITIIGILASLLMPVIGKMRESGNNVRCTANLRQLGTAINLYANEHDDNLPGPALTGVSGFVKSTQSSTFVYLLQPYLGIKLTPEGSVLEAFHCPSVAGDKLAEGKKWYDVNLYGIYSNNDLPTNQKYFNDVTVTDSTGNTGKAGPFGRLAVPLAPAWKRIQLSGGISQNYATLIDPMTKVQLTAPPTLAMIPACGRFAKIRMEKQPGFGVPALFL